MLLLDIQIGCNPDLNFLCVLQEASKIRLYCIGVSPSFSAIEKNHTQNERSKQGVEQLHLCVE